MEDEVEKKRQIDAANDGDVRVTKPEALAAALKTALASDGPSLVDVIVDPVAQA